MGVILGSLGIDWLGRKIDEAVVVDVDDAEVDAILILTMMVMNFFLLKWRRWLWKRQVDVIEDQKFC